MESSDPMELFCLPETIDKKVAYALPTVGTGLLVIDSVAIPEKQPTGLFQRAGTLCLRQPSTSLDNDPLQDSRIQINLNV